MVLFVIYEIVVDLSGSPINPGGHPNRTRRRLRPSVLRVRIRGCRDDPGASASAINIASREKVFGLPRSMRALMRLQQS